MKYGIVIILIGLFKESKLIWERDPYTPTHTHKWNDKYEAATSYCRHQFGASVWHAAEVNTLLITG